MEYRPNFPTFAKSINNFNLDYPMSSHIRHHLYIFIVALCVSTLSGYAQKYIVEIPIRDASTRRAFASEHYKCSCHVINPSDSSLVVRTWLIDGDTYTTPLYFKSSSYLVKVFATNIETGSTEDYETVWTTVNTSDAKGKIIRLPTIYLPRRKEKRLKEVEVTASKVKLYYKGDTLVFNADAFILPQGSRLDALIEQLPGVEMNRSGVIYCNGKKVEERLLNGKDLFNGKREVMLKNLGAYTVKDIAVYDKSGRLSELFEQDMDDKNYVMDVRLKRDYRHGFLVNAEGGYGTHNRYLGKLFGMWFSENVSMSVYGGANNLSDESTPGKNDGAWSRDRMGSGVRSRYYGGVTYLASNVDAKWEIKGNAEAARSIFDSQTNTVRQNYLSSGDTWNYSYNSFLNRSTSITTGHTFFTKFGRKVQLTINPLFKYSRFNSDSRLIDVALDRQLETASRNLLDSIYLYGVNGSTEGILNRSISETAAAGHNVNSSLSADANINIGNHPATLLSLSASASLDGSHTDRMQHYGLKFNSLSGVDKDELRHFKDYPVEKYSYLGFASVKRFFKTGRAMLPVKLTYSITHSRNTDTSNMFIVDGQSEALSIPDSYRSFIMQTRQNIIPELENGRVHGNFYSSFGLSIPIALLQRTIDYDGRGTHERLKRRDLLLGVTDG